MIISFSMNILKERLTSTFLYVRLSVIYQHVSLNSCLTALLTFYKSKSPCTVSDTPKNELVYKHQLQEL